MASPTRARKLPSFTGVAANSTAILALPLGMTYHSISLDHGALAVTNFSQIRVKVNGATIQEFTGAQLDALNQFYGHVAAASQNNVLHLMFDTPGVRTRAGREMTALGCAPYSESNKRPVQTVTIEIDLGAGASPAIVAYAKVSPPTPSGLVRKIKRFIYQPSATGDFEISDLPRGDAIAAMHFHKVADDITNVRVSADGFDIFDRNTDVNEAFQRCVDFSRVPIAAYWHVDPQEDGDAGEVMAPAAAEDFRVTLTLSTAAAVTALIEYVGPIPV